MVYYWPMDTIAFLLSLLWLVRILRNILSYVNLWYVKEYRWDRMMIHLRTPQGKRIYFLPARQPPITPKTITLVVSLLTAMVLLYVYLPFFSLVKSLVIDILMVPLSFLFVGILQIPTLLYHRIQIAKAVQLLRRRDDLLVIGITGSYGKTSTKEFLSTILATRDNVLKTEASKNSPIGIAEVVLKKLKPAHKIFVVEMAAYRPGEIASMVRMVRPQVGIVTAINAQHQDLFKTMETTMKAKFELLSGLVGKRIAICNMDNPYVRKMASWAKKDGCEVWGFTSQTAKSSIATTMFSATDIRFGEHTVACSVSDGKRRYSLTVALHGGHFITNILAAICGAVAAGMPLGEAVKGARLVRHVHKVMEIMKGPSGERLINDTFNNNPDAAVAAIRYMKQFSGKKYLVFQPMIELGGYTDQGHRQVGEVAGDICDAIILTNTNFFSSFAKGTAASSKKHMLHVFDTEKAATYLKKHVTRKDTVLFKGKEAEFVLKAYTG